MSSRSTGVFTWLIRLAALVAVTLLFYFFWDAGKGDMVQYWAASKLFWSHQNPYDYAALETLKAQQGSLVFQPFLTPPLILILSLPLGLLPFHTAATLWSVGMACSIMLSIHLLARIYPTRDYIFAWLFAPVIVTLMGGQAAGFVLLGVTLVLYWLDRGQLFRAGAATWLLLLKPHLFVVFGVALLIWFFSSQPLRKKSFVLGALLMFVCLNPIWIRPGVWQEWAAVMRSVDKNWFIPAFAVIPRLLIKGSAAWLQTVPLVIALAWVCFYFYTGRFRSWRENGALLLMISVIASPYAWFPDQIALLPVVMRALAGGARSFYLYLAFTLIALAQVFLDVPIGSMFFLWTPAAWLLLYAFSDASAAPMKSAASLS